MKNISLLVIHCSATPENADIKAKTINTWHMKRGFRKIGYHFVIRRSGILETGRSINETGAHAKGYNHNSIGICLIGGISDAGKPINNYTQEQWITLTSLCKTLLTLFPDATITGHRDLPNVHKECPCFDVSSWWLKQ